MAFVKDNLIKEASNLTGNIVFFGYGSQGRAQAQILRDEKIANIFVCLRENSKSKPLVLEDNFTLLAIEEAVKICDIAVFALPDEQQYDFYTEYFYEDLKTDATIIFLHGYCMSFSKIIIRKDLNYIMCAPKAAGEMLRKLYLQAKGCFAVTASYDNKQKGWDIAFAYARALGCHKAGIIKSSFKEECISDLFSEQAVLCGGLSHLIISSFSCLVKHGYSKEIAYIECLHEVKLIADLLHKYGISGVNEKISNTAEFGKYNSAKHFKDFPRIMENILSDIENNHFTDEFIRDKNNGFVKMHAQRKKDESLTVEKIGKNIRSRLN